MLTWPSRPGNNDDMASCQHVHVYKRCHSVVLQSASATLNDPLMSTVGSPSIGSQAVRGDAPWALGSGQLLNLSDGSGTIDVEPLDSEPQKRWHVGLGWETSRPSATAVAEPSTAYRESYTPIS